MEKLLNLPKISAVIVTKNAERCLQKVLKSIYDIVDEIIVVDSGSTDKTLEIAQRFKAKIFRQKWLGYGPQKNFGISKARNLWILSLDADEVVSVELAESIKKSDFSKDGYNMSFKNIFAGSWVRHSGWYPDWHLRLFRKDKMRFEESDVHELVRPKGKIDYLKGDVIHDTYLSNKHYFQKISVYTDLEAKYLYKKNRKWTMSYQLGKPIKEFYMVYFVRKGYMDGFLGLKIAVYSAYYRWLSAKKLKKLYKEK